MEHVTKSSHFNFFFSKGEEKKHNLLMIFVLEHYFLNFYTFLFPICSSCTENKFTHHLISSRLALRHDATTSYYTIKYTITFNNIKQWSYLKTIGIFVWQWGRPSIIAICVLQLSTKTLVYPEVRSGKPWIKMLWAISLNISCVYSMFTAVHLQY